LTSLVGRREATAERAMDAHMLAASDAEIASADFILSIVPPGEALSLAERFAPALKASNAKPVYADCNAINPATLERVAAAVAPTGCIFVDCGIIGPPPPRISRSQGDHEINLSGPRFYASGPGAAQFAGLRRYGLDVRTLQGPLHSASALKMSYAGITKGTQAVAAAMMLAAMRAGAGDALYDELAHSQKAALAQFKQQLPMMPAKAYRWVAEMEEIAGFVGDGSAAHELYEAAAHFYARMAVDFAANREDAAALEAFLRNDSAK
jgi:3-hydroxyisobutyrate dehydrogenase-like beta-hydroxyacid dehydrogenase